MARMSIKAFTAFLRQIQVVAMRSCSQITWLILLWVFYWTLRSQIYNRNPLTNCLLSSFENVTNLLILSDRTGSFGTEYLCARCNANIENRSRRVSFIRIYALRNSSGIPFDVFKFTSLMETEENVHDRTAPNGNLNASKGYSRRHWIQQAIENRKVLCYLHCCW